jgi:hypothetical protein
MATADETIRAGDEPVQPEAPTPISEQIRRCLTAKAATGHFSYHEAMNCVEMAEARAASQERPQPITDEQAEEWLRANDLFAVTHQHPPLDCAECEAAGIAQERPPIDVDIAAQTFHSMFHGGRTDLAKCRWNADDKANATMFVNRYARLAGGGSDQGPSKPQVITGYVNPDGSGKGNWSDDDES